MKNKKTVLIFSYIVANSFNIIFQRYLTFYFDSLTQNFYRYITGSLFLLIVSFFLYREDIKRIFEDRELIKKIFLLSFVAAVDYFLFTVGLAKTSAPVAGFINIFGLPLTFVPAFFIFSDERKVVKEKNFIFGFFLAVAGTIGLIFSKGRLNLEYSVGIFYLVIYNVLAVFVSLGQKKIVTKLNPLCLTAVITFFMSFFFFAGSLIWGDLPKITHVPALVNTVLFISGAYGMVAGIGLYLINMKISGLLVTKIAELAIPVTIAFFSYVFLKESLNIPQIISGLVLIFGSLLIFLNR